MEISPDIFENTQSAFAAKSDTALQKAKALFSVVGNNLFVRAGSSLAMLALKLHLPVSPVFKWTVYDHFCGGETFEECKLTIEALQKAGVGVLLNYGVELKESEADFDKALKKNTEAIEFAGVNRAVTAVCLKPTGFARMALLEKVQKEEKLSAAEQKEWHRVQQRFEELCQVADRKNVMLYLDAEETWIQDALDNMVEDLMSRFNREKCVVCNTLQMYRWDRIAYLNEQIKKAKAGGYYLGLKLVRGAYMEIERERAAEMNYKSPIHENKQKVDADFDKAVEVCLDHHEWVYTCVASQNEYSNLRAMREMLQRKIDPKTEKVVFSQLYGMGDNVTFNQAQAGFNATKYLPYGSVKEVIPYLIRRAQENTSVAGQTGRELALINKEIKRRKKQKRK